MGNKYGRLIGIDLGTKKVGIARTDLLKLSVNPVGTFKRDTVIDELRKQIKDDTIDGIVIGWPLEPDGSEGHMTEMVDKFIGELHDVFPDLPIEKVDERYTSKQAVQNMIDAGVPRMKRRDKKRIDRTAAAIILQNYLEMNF